MDSRLLLLLHTKRYRMRCSHEIFKRNTKELTEKLIEFKTFDNASKRQVEILEKLKETGKTRLIDFEKSAKTTRATLNKLEALGCVEITQEQVFRNPVEIFKQQNLEPFPPLLDEQKPFMKR